MGKIISVSIVVHRNAELADKLLNDLNYFSTTINELIITYNLPENLDASIFNFDFPVTIIENKTPKGFGANHNFAYHQSRCDFFCIINPDIRLTHDPFPILLKALQDEDIALTSPLIRTPTGSIEDNYRTFPTPMSIATKLINKWPKIEYPLIEKSFVIDWAAGMFILFRSEAYRRINGFDEKYHLYYEDVDICARLKLAGYKIMACPSVSVIHDARRESHHNPKFLRWHIQSMLRFFFSRTFRQVRALKSS